MKKVLLALAAFLLASVASANPVIVDPDGLAQDTDLSTAFPGVTLRHIAVVADANSPDGASLVVDSVYAKECSDTSNPNSRCSALGSGYFGHTGIYGGSFVAESDYSINCITDNPGPCKWSPHHFLDVTFDAAVQEVSIDAIHLSDWAQAWAFDAAGNRLQINRQRTWHQGPSDPSAPFYHETLTVTPVTGQISRIVFSGWGGFVNLDKLTYTLP